MNKLTTPKECQRLLRLGLSGFCLEQVPERAGARNTAIMGYVHSAHQFQCSERGKDAYLQHELACKASLQAV